MRWKYLETTFRAGRFLVPHSGQIAFLAPGLRLVNQESQTSFGRYPVNSHQPALRYPGFSQPNLLRLDLCWRPLLSPDLSLSSLSLTFTDRCIPVVLLTGLGLATPTHRLVHVPAYGMDLLELPYLYGRPVERTLSRCGFGTMIFDPTIKWQLGSRFCDVATSGLSMSTRHTQHEPVCAGRLNGSPNADLRFSRNNYEEATT